MIQNWTKACPHLLRKVGTHHVGKEICLFLAHFSSPEEKISGRVVRSEGFEGNTGEEGGFVEMRATNGGEEGFGDETWLCKGEKKVSGRH